MDDQYIMSSRAEVPAAIDTEVLDSLFSMGGDALRGALSAQLVTDFRRLKATLAGEDMTAVARAAHELKGLSATVGANRLADMARSIDAVAEGLPHAALRVVVVPLATEIDAVLDYLNTLMAGAPST